MRILVINPNSDEVMTSTIRRAAAAHAAGEVEVDCRSTPGAPKFIETYQDEIAAAPGMLDLVRSGEGEFDGFVVACHCDPNLDALKEAARKPVVGIGEASMKLATMLGHRFSVVATDRHSVPKKEALIAAYGLRGAAASVRAPDSIWQKLDEEERLYRTALAAVEEDGAEVIVLGCAGLADMCKQLQARLGVPVLEGVSCALNIVTGFIRSGLSTSKRRRYNPEYR